MDARLMNDRMLRIFGSEVAREPESPAPIVPTSEPKQEPAGDVLGGPGDDDDDDDDDSDDGDDDEDDDYSDDGEDDSFDDSYGEDEDEDEEGDDESFAKKKLNIAKDPYGVISEDGRIVFVKDHENPERIYMVARVDNILPKEFKSDGTEMWVGDIMFRLKGRGYSEPEQTIRGVNPEIFKKKNWSSRVEE